MKPDECKPEAPAALPPATGSASGQYGIRIAFGTRPEYATMPITNLPPGTIKVRRRLRNTSAAVAFVKTATTVEKWVLAPDGENELKLQILQGINARMPNSISSPRLEGQ